MSFIPRQPSLFLQKQVFPSPTPPSSEDGIRIRERAVDTWGVGGCWCGGPAPTPPQPHSWGASSAPCRMTETLQATLILLAGGVITTRPPSRTGYRLVQIPQTSPSPPNSAMLFYFLRNKNFSPGIYLPQHVPCPIFSLPPISTSPVISRYPPIQSSADTTVCSILYVLAQARAQPILSDKGQIENIFDCADQRVSVAATQILLGKVKANMGLVVCVPIKLYL